MFLEPSCGCIQSAAAPCGPCPNDENIELFGLPVKRGLLSLAKTTRERESNLLVAAHFEFLNLRLT